MSGVFISYRRNDSSWFARSLFDALRAAFPGHAIFIDVEGIDAGLDFVEVVEERLSSCEVLLAIIGRKWLEEAGPTGNRRIDDPNDYVRAEIEAALKRKIRVIPVLVDGAQMPSQQDLPESLASLSRRHGLEITHARFSSDTTHLVDVLSSIMPGRKAAGPAKTDTSPKTNKSPKAATPPKVAHPEAGEAPGAARPPAARSRWLVAGGATLIIALSAVVAGRAWPTLTSSAAPPGKAAPATVAAPAANTAATNTAATTTAATTTAATTGAAPATVAASVLETGRSTATGPAAAIPAPAPEASVPYIFPNTYSPEKPPAASPAVAKTEPGNTPADPTPADPAAPSFDPLAFKNLPEIDVVSTTNLDTSKASAKLRIGGNKYAARKASCDKRAVFTEFGNYSMIDTLVETLPSAKGDICFYKTTWKDHRSGKIANNAVEQTPRLLNQTLHLLCPTTYEGMVKDCKAY